MPTRSPEPVALYGRALDATGAYVRGVGSDQWSDPTPCTEWSVRDIVNHLVGEHYWADELFQGHTIEQVSDRLDGDLLGGDPVEAYETSARVARTAVEAPGAMERICHLSFGDAPGVVYTQQLFMDELIHGWDVATATGQDARLDPELVAICWEAIQPVRDTIRASDVFGEEVTVPDDADPQTKLLGVLGRRG